VHWETLTAQGSGSVSDLSSSGCFVLSGGEVTVGELMRMELISSDGIAGLWGNVVYAINEMGFAVRFVFGSEADRETVERVIRSTQ
jgi:PilZ domain